MNHESDYSYIQCEHVGLSGTTPVTLRKQPDGTIEARMGFALFGYTNMSNGRFKRAGWNPFHPEFHDNYATGKGATEDEAIAALKKDVTEIHESLW
jgi:hypothetical protein